VGPGLLHRWSPQTDADTIKIKVDACRWKGFGREGASEYDAQRGRRAIGESRDVSGRREHTRRQSKSRRVEGPGGSGEGSAPGLDPALNAELLLDISDAAKDIFKLAPMHHLIT
jgi:hypothetical protein